MAASILTPEEIEEFKSDAFEMLDEAERSLLAIDSGRDPVAFYDGIFRVFHSLKGGAGMAGLSGLQDHVHKIEGLLSQCHPTKGAAHLLARNASLFLEAVDATRRLLDGDSVTFKYQIESAAPASPVAGPTPAPVPEKTPATEPEPLSVAKATLTEKIVVHVVDDEPQILEAIADILNDSGVTTRTFTDPMALLENLKSETPDVVISDYRMPQMDGGELLKQIRELNQDLPVIFVSGHLTKSVLINSIESGLFAVLEKPFQESSLIGNVLAAARAHRLQKLFSKTLRALLYQYADLDDFLASSGRNEIRQSMKEEIAAILYLNRQMKRPNRDSVA